MIQKPASATIAKSRESKKGGGSAEPGKTCPWWPDGQAVGRCQRREGLPLWMQSLSRRQRRASGAGQGWVDHSRIISVDRRRGRRSWGSPWRVANREADSSAAPCL